jgi:hypothetical protein
VVEVPFPREGDRILSTTLSSKVEFTVIVEFPLASVTAEVLGEHLGVFFTICGVGSDRCAGDQPICCFDLKVPVFAGMWKKATKESMSLGVTALGNKGS